MHFVRHLLSRYREGQAFQGETTQKKVFTTPKFSYESFATTQKEQSTTQKKNNTTQKRLPITQSDFPLYRFACEELSTSRKLKYTRKTTFSWQKYKKKVGFRAIFINNRLIFFHSICGPVIENRPANCKISINNQQKNILFSTNWR